jgi:hypothetical protein
MINYFRSRIIYGLLVYFKLNHTNKKERKEYSLTYIKECITTVTRRPILRSLQCVSTRFRRLETKIPQFFSMPCDCHHYTIVPCTPLTPMPSLAARISQPACRSQSLDLTLKLYCTILPCLFILVQPFLFFLSERLTSE